MRTSFVALATGLVFASQTYAQTPGTADGQWRYVGGDAAHTRFSPNDQVGADNFADIEEAWACDGASIGAASGRSTPIYVDGTLYTVAGARRHIVAIDPATVESIWSYREPSTPRWEYSMHKDHGKDVGYADIDDRGIIYTISPGSSLTALDARTGRHGGFLIQALSDGSAE